MTLRFAPLAAAPLLLALAVSASAAAPKAAPKPTPLPDTVRVAMVTELGTITLDLDAKAAPITTRNFVRYVDQRRFDGIAFYRVMRLKWGEQPNGLVQAGTRGDPRRALPPIAHEPTNVTGVLHKAGAISMARYTPGTAAGDFSILLSDMPGLDADPNATTDDGKAGFAAFGHVVEGMDVVRKIYDVPLSATLGEGVMRGQMIEKPVKVLTVRRVAVPAPPAVAPAPIPIPAPAPPPSAN
ncbi:peptidylprolyl isomerase [Novosphingobium sp. JCM 18896]|uniref:peptidylprolyl isomerase n=1 Tax=Novosphingobium sp. JCM 18896 TaxID=2989731 RepID=UPI0022217F02|nr:peptidylprolyl isomerase [Novosphingobium sp. JCM 18896]MCW1428101.1 peptidylprolyl isomerase [Novosphingobium sp. JCM 18896]